MDVLKIKDDFESIVVYSQDYPFELDSANLIKQWLNSKEKFIKMFHGNTLIRSKERIRVSIGEKQKKEKFNRFLDVLKQRGVLTEDFNNFLLSNEEGFFTNKVLVPFPEKNIPSGAKLSKTFKKFIGNARVVRWAQD